MIYIKVEEDQYRTELLYRVSFRKFSCHPSVTPEYIDHVMLT